MSNSHFKVLNIVAMKFQPINYRKNPSTRMHSSRMLTISVGGVSVWGVSA